MGYFQVGNSSEIAVMFSIGYCCRGDFHLQSAAEELLNIPQPFTKNKNNMAKEMPETA
ncbi:MAG: hypothetical protein V2B20_25790 [Pseudomonadota bacterium]